MFTYLRKGEHDDRDSYSDESSSDYPEMDFPMPSFGGFFDGVGSMFSPLGSYVPSFLYFGQNSYDDDDEGVKNDRHSTAEPNKYSANAQRKPKNKNSALR